MISPKLGADLHADDAAAEAKVAGGANIMLQKAVWRVCCHDATSAAAAAAALVAGTRLGGPRVVASITGLSLYSGIRSFGVPAVRAAQVCTMCSACYT